MARTKKAKKTKCRCVMKKSGKCAKRKAKKRIRKATTKR